MSVTLDATQPGTARLEVGRGGRTLGQSMRTIESGRHRLTLKGSFARAHHDITVTLTDATGATAAEHVKLFVSSRLALRMVPSALRYDIAPRCHRFGPRRIDCSVLLDNHDPNRDSDPCYGHLAFRLSRNGVLLDRRYRDWCTPTRRPLVARARLVGRWSPSG